MTYTKETGKKWQNEVGKTSHMKVLMVHDEDDCGKECTATVPCVAFTFIPGMEICALKAPKDAATLVHAGLASFLTLMQLYSPYCRRKYDLWQA